MMAKSKKNVVKLQHILYIRVYIHRLLPEPNMKQNAELQNAYSSPNMIYSLLF
jgi:hypothetical protein